MAILEFPHDLVGYPERSVYTLDQPKSSRVTSINKGSPVSNLLDTNVMKNLSLQWYMSQPQLQQFEYTWETLLRYGERPVSLYIPTENGYEYRYVYILKYSYSVLSSTHYTLTTTLQVDNGSLGQ